MAPLSEAQRQAKRIQDQEAVASQDALNELEYLFGCSQHQLADLDETKF